MANILILRSANTSDKDIKTGVAEVELEKIYPLAERKFGNIYKKIVLN